MELRLSLPVFWGPTPCLPSPQFHFVTEPETTHAHYLLNKAGGFGFGDLETCQLPWTELKFSPISLRSLSSLPATEVGVLSVAVHQLPGRELPQPLPFLVLFLPVCKWTAGPGSEDCGRLLKSPPLCDASRNSTEGEVKEGWQNWFTHRKGSSHCANSVNATHGQD